MKEGTIIPQTPGTAGQILTSTGAGSAPTFQDNAGGEPNKWLNDDGSYAGVFTQQGNIIEHLEVADGADIRIMANNTDYYVVDFWVKLNQTSNHSNLFYQYINTTNSYFRMYHAFNSKEIFIYFNNGGSVQFDVGSGISWTDTDWHHVALIVNGTGAEKEVSVFVDGVQGLHTTTSANQTASNPLYIGQRPNVGAEESMKGYLEGYRITKGVAFGGPLETYLDGAPGVPAEPNSGVTGRYDLPTQQDNAPTNDSGNTKLLLNFNEQAYTDESDVGRVVEQHNEISNGLVQGWCNWNGISPYEIYDSFNVSSITDSGIGQANIFWDTDFNNDRYAVSGMGHAVGVGGNMMELSANAGVGAAQTPGEVKLRTVANGGSNQDCSTCTVIAIGDMNGPHIT